MMDPPVTSRSIVLESVYPAIRLTMNRFRVAREEKSIRRICL